MTRVFKIAPLLLAGLLAAPAAMACTQCDDKAATAAPTPRAEANALTVVRDAETGKLRAATASELADLAQARTANAAPLRGARTVPTTPLVRRLATGALRSRMTDDFSTYSVVTRQADGSLAQVCVESAEAAAALVARPAPAPVSRPVAAATE